mmetsp:Transcript_31838/g.93536  ORF Transcript_31838/g.93536 Transcript_31838/m.93536 type:complete len:103 (-) Transcript_31838:1505-1813(-)
MYKLFACFAIDSVTLLPWSMSTIPHNRCKRHCYLMSSERISPPKRGGGVFSPPGGDARTNFLIEVVFFLVAFDWWDVLEVERVFPPSFLAADSYHDCDASVR